MDPVSVRANVSDLLECLNARHFHLLPLFLSPNTITVNNVASNALGYSAQLQLLIAQAPDMTFRLGKVMVDQADRRATCLLAIEATPASGYFRGFKVNDGAVGKKVRYFETVTWKMDADGRIEGVESMVDEDAVAKQCKKKNRPSVLSTL